MILFAHPELICCKRLCMVLTVWDRWVFLFSVGEDFKNSCHFWVQELFKTSTDIDFSKKWFIAKGHRTLSSHNPMMHPYLGHHVFCQWLVNLHSHHVRKHSQIHNLKYVKTRQIWGIWKLRPAYSPETPNLGQNRWRFVPCDLEIWWMTLKNNRASPLCCFKLCATFHSHRWIQPGVTSGNAQFGSNSTNFRAVWPWNLTYDLEKQ